MTNETAELFWNSILVILHSRVMSEALHTANTELAMPDTRGAWADCHSHLQALSIIGARRFHVFGRVREVPVDGARLHLTFSSILEKILRPRLWRSGYVLPSDVTQHITAASNHLAKMVILQMAVVLRNKLAASGQATRVGAADSGR